MIELRNKARFWARYLKYNVMTHRCDLIFHLLSSNVSSEVMLLCLITRKCQLTTHTDQVSGLWTSQSVVPSFLSTWKQSLLIVLNLLHNQHCGASWFTDMTEARPGISETNDVCSLVLVSPPLILLPASEEMTLHQLLEKAVNSWQNRQQQLTWPQRESRDINSWTSKAHLPTSILAVTLWKY